MTTSEQLERETERTREQIAATLDELRARMTPGQVVDQLFDYAQDSSGGLFLQNLRRQVVNNPLPVALMGAGLAWLAMANRSGPGNGSSGARTDGAMNRFGRRAHDAIARSAEAAGDWADEARGTAANTTSDMSRQARQAGASAANAASSAYERAKDATSSSYTAAAETASAAYDSAAQRAAAATAGVRSAAGSAAETASATYDAAAEHVRRTGAKVSESAGHVRENISGASRNVMGFLAEQPLALVGLGIALGAVIGAALPSTEAEDELIGEKSDALKHQATKLAGEQIDKGTAVAEHAWQGAREEGAKQGLTPSSGDGASDSDGQHAQSGAEAGPYAQGATGGGEEATLVPSAGGDTEDHKLERSRT